MLLNLQPSAAPQEPPPLLCGVPFCHKRLVTLTHEPCVLSFLPSSLGNGAEQRSNRHQKKEWESWRSSACHASRAPSANWNKWQLSRSAIPVTYTA
ncbi:hypothetical protein AOLI_G00143830 [Acnodon oligacanthus]